jgi:hypothetical protein
MWNYRTAKPRKYGQTIRAIRAFHQISLAKAMVNIQPADQNTPAILPDWTMVRVDFVSVDMDISPYWFFSDPNREQHF